MIGVLARAAGLFAPFRYTVMPWNFSCSLWLSLSFHFSASGLHWRIMGSSFASTVRSASLSDGYTIMVGPGSWSMTAPSIFSMAEVPPTWVGFTNTIRSTLSSENVSMISTRYGVMRFLHGPGMAFVSGNIRYFSAHFDTGRRSRGRRVASAFLTHGVTA